MAKIHKYSIDDLRKDFPNEEACLAVLFDTLHSRKCSCGGEYKQIKGRKQFQCGKCRYQIAPAAGTIFHKSDTPLSLWFHAIFIFSNAKSGISAKEMERQLGVTYKCAYRILSQIRKALKQDDDKLQGNVEIDSTYMGEKGRHNEVSDKAVVIAAVERGGRVKTEIIKSSGTTPINDFINR